MKPPLIVIGSLEKEPSMDYTAGLRNMSVPMGLFKQLSLYYDVEYLDTVGLNYKECGISKILGNRRGTVFVIQNDINFRKDVEGIKIIYLHIDDKPSLNASDVELAYYIYWAPGCEAYKINENQEIIQPFCFIDYFNPDREKDILLSNIPRDVPFEEYKDLMERSKFTIINAYNWLSKRTLEAIACKTIPIVVTGTPEMYRHFGLKDNWISLLSSPDMNQDQYDRDASYKWLKNNHTAKIRVEQMKRGIDNIMNGNT